jgi:hypothetical protein
MQQQQPWLGAAAVPVAGVPIAAARRGGNGMQQRQRGQTLAAASCPGLQACSSAPAVLEVEDEIQEEVVVHILEKK